MQSTVDDLKLLAISYSDQMACQYHAEMSGGHIEKPKRLSSILKLLKESEITLEPNKTTKLMDHLEFFSCNEVSKDILLLCHTEKYLRSITYWTKEIKKFDLTTKQTIKGFDDGKLLSMYPLDVETYMTPKSESIAKMAVGSLIELCNIIMKSKLKLDSKEFCKISVKQDPDSNSTDQSGLNSDKNQAKECVKNEFTTEDLFNIQNSLRTLRKGFALVRPPGHHSTPDKMMGFCIFNNVAIAAKYLQHKHGLRKIAIVDWDVHHGNGTQDIFYDDSSVCFISLHRYGTDEDSYYPYTGYCDELGVGKAYRYNVNIPLEKGFTNDDLVHSFEQVVIPVLERFEPEFILVSAGFDAGKDDIIGGCNLDTRGYSWASRKLCEVAEKFCKGRLLFSLEGGYTVSRLSEDVEAVINTVVKYEYRVRNPGPTELFYDDEDFDFHLTYFKQAYDEDAMESTVAVCKKLRNLLGLYDLSKDLEELTLTSKPKKLLVSDSDLYPDPDRDHGENNVDVPQNVEKTDLSGEDLPKREFIKYPFEVDNNALIIAGGHQNQWILPLRGKNQQIIKLCSKKEIDFFHWIYKQNGRSLQVYNQPVEEFKIQFTSVPQNIIRTGIRLTNPSKEVNGCNGVKTENKDLNDKHELDSDQTTTASNTDKDDKDKTSPKEKELKEMKQEEEENKEKEKEKDTKEEKKENNHSNDLSQMIKKMKEEINGYNSTDLNGWSNTVDIIKFISECSGIFEPFVFENWKLGTKCGLRLKNALFGMKIPCVMDLKMGTRLYGDDCTDLEEIKQKEIKASGRSCKTHGFHVSGIFKWDTLGKVVEYVPQQVVYNAKSDDDLLELFKLYLSGTDDKEQRKQVLDGFLKRLEKLRTIFQNQKNLAFYGSSLLFVYDAQNKSDRDNVSMIDLSHVSYNVQSLDHGYLLGLNSIIRLLKLTRDQVT